eukprot:1497902-Amphidinium_carterae.1
MRLRTQYDKTFRQWQPVSDLSTLLSANLSAKEKDAAGDNTAAGGSSKAGEPNFESPRKSHRGYMKEPPGMTQQNQAAHVRMPIEPRTPYSCRVLEL